VISIRRYPNRKLYNTETRQYINLDEVADLIRMGEEIDVQDYASGKNLTFLTISQVLLDQVKKRGGFLPGKMLAGLIQAGSRHVSDLKREFTTTHGFSQLVDEEIQRRIDFLVEQGKFTVEEGGQLLSQLVTAKESKESLKEYETHTVEGLLEQQGVPKRADILELREQIEGLEKKIEELQLDLGLDSASTFISS